MGYAIYIKKHITDKEGAPKQDALSNISYSK